MILTLTDEGSNAGSCLVHERGDSGSGWALNYKDNTIRKGCIGKIFINQSGCLRCPPETPLTLNAQHHWPPLLLAKHLESRRPTTPRVHHTLPRP